MSMLGTGWEAAKYGIWEYRVSGDDRIFFTSAEAFARRRELGYDFMRCDQATQHSVIHVRPMGTDEWGWHSGHYHRERA